MHAQIHTIAFRGIEAIDVTVQIHIANGLPAMVIVGLADKAHLSARAYHKIMRVPRTIVDLAGEDRVSRTALAYRAMPLLA